MHTKHLPSMTALRAFEAAARTESFTRAGHELHVTQGAISRIIKELEAQVGVALFVREARRIALTADGKRYYHIISDTLQRIADGTAELADRRSEQSLTVTMLPSVGAKWLAPRLAHFVAHHPTIELHTVASRTLTNLAMDGCDAAIRYGRGNWPGTHAELLAKEVFTPVCSPAFARKHRLRTPADLLTCTLLHSDEITWRDWFKAAGLTGDTPSGPVFNEGTALIQAAIDGAGVALGRSFLIEQDIAAGRLIAPFSINIAAPFSYWFVTPQGRPLRPVTKAFRKWLFKQCGTSPH
jgi:LysR family glycine cleavage system transcriptional activator